MALIGEPIWLSFFISVVYLAGNCTHLLVLGNGMKDYVRNHVLHLPKKSPQMISLVGMTSGRHLSSDTSSNSSIKFKVGSRYLCYNFKNVT